MGGVGAALSFPGVMLQGCKAIFKRSRTPVIWLQGQSCSGCSVSLLNTVDPDIASLITTHISLNFHQTVSTATGDVAINILDNVLEKGRKDFILIVEGSIPTDSDYYCTLGEKDGHHHGIREWIEKLGNNAKAIVAIGTCSAYGGIPAAEMRTSEKNPTGATSLAKILPKRKVVNVPGCPPHPDWMAGTLLQVILKGVPRLDAYNRPLKYFKHTVHDHCERLQYYKEEKFAESWGEEGCLYNLGCLGIDTNCDIPKRKWLSGMNSCTGSGSGCIGCTEPVFPNTGKRGLYEHKRG